MANRFSNRIPKAFGVWTIVLMLNSICSGLLFAQVAPETTSFKDPNGAFTVNMPAGWHVIQIPHVGQRVTILSREERTADDLKTSYDPDAELMIKLFRMNQDDLSMSRQAIVDRYLEFLTQMYKQQFNLDLEITKGEDTTINGLACSTAHTVCGNTISDMWIATSDGIFVELKSSYDRDSEASAKSVLMQLARSFRLGERAPALKSTMIKATTRSIQFAAPAGWFVKRYDNDSAEQLFVSREKVEKPEDMFQVGISMNIFKDVRKIWDLDGPVDPEQVMRAWLDITVKSTRDNNGQFFAIELTRLGGLPMLKFERGFQGSTPGVFIHEYHVTIINGLTLIDMILEAPVMEFEQYRTTFDHAIQSLQVAAETE